MSAHPITDQMVMAALDGFWGAVPDHEIKADVKAEYMRAALESAVRVSPLVAVNWGLEGEVVDLRGRCAEWRIVHRHLSNERDAFRDHLTDARKTIDEWSALHQTAIAERDAFKAAFEKVGEIADETQATCDELEQALRWLVSEVDVMTLHDMNPLFEAQVLLDRLGGSDANVVGGSDRHDEHGVSTSAVSREADDTPTDLTSPTPTTTLYYSAPGIFGLEAMAQRDIAERMRMTPHEREVRDAMDEALDDLADEKAGPA